MNDMDPSAKGPGPCPGTPRLARNWGAGSTPLSTRRNDASPSPASPGFLLQPRRILLAPLAIAAAAALVLGLVAGHAGTGTPPAASPGQTPLIVPGLLPTARPRRSPSASPQSGPASGSTG